MGGEGSGGPRSGKPGATYSNRSDLSGDASHPPGVTQEAVRESTPNAAPPMSVPPPGSFGSLTAPTGRPDEPVTAGLALGEGPPPAGGTVHDPSLWELRALAQQFPDNRDLLAVIARAEQEL